MELHLKITIVVLLLPQVVHLASLEVTTDSPAGGVEQEWLDQILRNSSPKGETETGQGTESSNDYSSGTSSGSMAPYNEEENLTSQEESENRTSDINTNTNTNTATSTNTNMTTNTNTNSNTTANINTTELPTPPENLQPTNQSELTPAPKDTPDLPPSQINITDTDEKFKNETTTPQNSTTPSPAPISTGSPEFSNGTDVQGATVAPESGNTNQTKQEEDAGLTNSTDATDETQASTAAQEVTDPATTSSPSQTTVWIPEPTMSAATTKVPPSTPEKANMTGKDGGSGSNAERGTASNTHSSSRSSPWGAILGTLVAVAFVGFMAYIILKKKHQKAFSHRKLVEEFPSDPVLRLDNSEPLDLNFGGSAYYNPALQGDNIQMSNFPPRH